jgi:hypothetical protein
LPEHPELTMHAAVCVKRDTLADLCRLFRVHRPEVSGSAARGLDFDAQHSYAGLLVEVEPTADPASLPSST